MENIRKPSYKSGYFKTSDNHNLYYELWGNPNGKPVVYLHGGPGAGFDDSDTGYFDPTVWNVLFFDQRGAGKSTPFASLTHNTTQDLVEDIQKLMDFVGFKKALLFGGSWGSTLALCFAITYPEHITAMLLRGICTYTPEEQTYYIGGGTKKLFPNAWNRLISHVPSTFTTRPITYYYEKIVSGTREEKEKYSYEFTRYEARLLLPTVSETELDTFLQQDTTWKSLGPLEMHYIAHGCFLPPNYIYSNIASIQAIPTAIVHGTQDMIAPVFAAEKLHKALPNSTLCLTNAGHSGKDTENKESIIQQLKKFEKLL